MCFRQRAAKINDYKSKQWYFNPKPANVLAKTMLMIYNVKHNGFFIKFSNPFQSNKS